MLQVFRLVEGGHVDKMIAFDVLPERLLTGIRKRDLAGLPRYWKKFACEGINPSTREPVFFHYFLDYKDVNSDKEKWGEIIAYVRRAVDIKTRLMDKLEDMAVAMAPDPKSPLELEPENIPVIAIPVELIVPSDPQGLIKEEEARLPNEKIGIETVSEEPKRRGRPKKVAVGA